MKPPHRPRNPSIALLLALVLALSWAPSGGARGASSAGAGSAGAISVLSDGLWELEARGWPAPEGIDAPSWIVVDVTTGQVLGSRRASDPRPPASTTKLLTALAVARSVPGDDVVTVSETAASQVGASTGLTTGMQLRVDDLLALLLLRSGNDAAVALAEHTAGSLEAFADLMAREASVLGLERFVLAEPHGLDDRNLLSARQLAVIGRAVLADDRLRQLVAAPSWRLTTGQVVTNRNQLLGAYPGATGLKTGMTSAAGWSLVASARRGPVHLVAVVLGGSDDAARFSDARTLLDHGFDAFASAPAVPALRLRGEAAWLEVDVDTPRIMLPHGAAVTFEPELPVEPLSPMARWSWDADGVAGSFDHPAHFRAGISDTSAVLTLVVGQEPGRTDGGTGALGAWLAGRVQAGLRAATVAGLWDD